MHIQNILLDDLEEASKSEQEFKEFIDFGRELDRHYIGSRYPNFYPSGAPYKYYTKEMAEKCVNYAGSILKEVKKYLEK